MRKYHTLTAPMTFICLSGAQITAHAIHHGFTHASHTSTHASHTSTHASHTFYHAYLPRSLSRVPRKHGRDCGIVSAIAANGVVVLSPKGFCFKISVFPQSFLFLNSSNSTYYSVSNKARWVLTKY